MSTNLHTRNYVLKDFVIYHLFQEDLTAFSELRDILCASASVIWSSKWDSVKSLWAFYRRTMTYRCRTKKSCWVHLSQSFIWIKENAREQETSKRLSQLFSKTNDRRSTKLYFTNPACFIEIKEKWRKMVFHLSLKHFPQPFWPRVPQKMIFPIRNAPKDYAWEVPPAQTSLCRRAC